MLYNLRDANQIKIQTLMRRVEELADYLDTVADEDPPFDDLLNDTILFLQQDEIRKMSNKFKRRPKRKRRR